MNRDQAAGLRRLMERRARGINLEFHNTVSALFPPALGSTVFLGSEQEVLSLGLVTVNCAAELYRLGRRVALLEGHSNKINASLLLGIESPLTLGALSQGTVFLNNIIYRSSQGLRLIRGLEALEGINSWLPEARAALFRDLRLFLGKETDQVFISEVNPRFSLLKKRVVLVFSPAKESVISAYANLKKIVEAECRPEISCIVANADSGTAEKIGNQFVHTARQFLKQEITCLGNFPVNEEVVRSIKKKELFVDMYRYTVEARMVRVLAGKLAQAAEQGQAVPGR